MKQRIVKFLEFNGNNLYFLDVNGKYWIAVKPVCEALNIEYTRIFKNLKTDPILAPRLAKLPMMIPGDTQPRKYVCIPEYLIYGWIFSIQSDSRELLSYKLECYEVLFNHFHGAITGRTDLLRDKARLVTERLRLENSLKQLPEYKQLEQIKIEESRIGKALVRNDNEIINLQLELFQ